MNLTPRQKGLLTISGGAAALSGALLAGRATVRPAVTPGPGNGADAGAMLLSTCGPTDLRFGTSLTYDATAKLYIASDGHECQKIAPTVPVDRQKDGGLVVSDHLATQVCNHLAAIGCRQPQGCAASAHAQKWTASSPMPQCLLAAHTPAAAAVCAPSVVCR